jgi:putative ABC transport system permease protein
MGLFGLTLFEVERRVKEIGIRKILGASVTQIVYLIGSSLIRLIIVALILAVPLSYWLMDKWLAEFAYKISINPFPFILGGVLSFIITAATVGYQAIRASMANPVNALKND